MPARFFPRQILLGKTGNGKGVIMETGIKNSLETVVTDNQTAEFFDKDLLPVLSTPHMIQLMEKTARLSVQPFLDKGQGTVGTEVNVKHLASTGVGKKVRCESELIKIDGKRLLFSVKAFNEQGLIGEGTHERCIINEEKFRQRLGV